MTTTKPTSGAVRGRERNRRGEGGLLRDEIVRAALALLDETGDSQAATLRAIARHIGISPPSIYPHFRDRQAILLAALQQAFEEFHRHLREAVEGAGDDPADRLRAICAGYLSFARARPQRYLVMFGGVWNAVHDIAEEKVDRSDVAALGMAALDELVTLFRACVENGSSDSTDPVADATVLWLAMHGLAHQRIVSTAFDWPADIETRLVDRLTYL